MSGRCRTAKLWNNSNSCYRDQNTSTISHGWEDRKPFSTNEWKHISSCKMCEIVLSFCRENNGAIKNESQIVVRTFWSSKRRVPLITYWITLRLYLQLRSPPTSPSHMCMIEETKRFCQEKNTKWYCLFCARKIIWLVPSNTFIRNRIAVALRTTWCVFHFWGSPNTQVPLAVWLWAPHNYARIAPGNLFEGSSHARVPRGNYKKKVNITSLPGVLFTPPPHLCSTAMHTAWRNYLKSDHTIAHDLQ